MTVETVPYGLNSGVDVSDNSFSREAGREAVAWDRVFRLGAVARIFRCANCGREPLDAHGIMLEMLVVDRPVRERHRHKCADCGAPMPWMDERSYGVRRA